MSFEQSRSARGAKRKRYWKRLAIKRTRVRLGYKLTKKIHPKKIKKMFLGEIGEFYGCRFIEWSPLPYPPKRWRPRKIHYTKKFLEDRAEYREELRLEDEADRAWREREGDE